MATPLTVAITPTSIVGTNYRRQTLYLQNVGTFPIYLKKGAPNLLSTTVPSITNYDFVLSAGRAANDGKGGVLRIDVISSFIGVAIGGASAVTIMETVNG